jgi:hypothetical protein
MADVGGWDIGLIDTVDSGKYFDFDFDIVGIGYIADSHEKQVEAEDECCHPVIRRLED